MQADRVEAIQALLARAQEAHAVFEATELSGVYDADWPRWYAAYAVEHGIGALLGRDVTADHVEQFLASSNQEFERIDPKPDGGWASYTARRMAAEL